MPRNLQKNTAYLELKESIQNQKRTRFLYVPSVYSKHIDAPKPDGVISKFMAPVKGDIRDIHIFVGFQNETPIQVNLIGVDKGGAGSYAELPLKKGHNEFNEAVVSLGDGSRIKIVLDDASKINNIGDIFIGFTFHPDPSSFGKQIRVDK